MGIRRAFRITVPLLLFLLACITSDLYAASTSRWIVTYRNSRYKAAAIQSRLRKVRRDYKIIPAYAADLTTTEVVKLKKNPAVISVQPDAIRHAIKTNSTSLMAAIEAIPAVSTASTTSGYIVPYGIDLINARSVWTYTKGSGVKIADIDTGIDLNHVDLPTIAASRSFTNSSIQDTDGHGTHTAGTMAAPGVTNGVIGVAPEASLLIAQVFDSEGNAYDSDIVSAIEWAVENGAKVINMSLGGSTPDSALESACNSAVASGVVLVAAAGNDGDNSLSYPAAYSSVISVAAVDQSKTRASFSNYGSTIDLCAPGVDVLSSVLTGKGWLTSANWSGVEHQTYTMIGSANGTATGNAVYCGLGNTSEFPSSVNGQIAHIRRGTLTFQQKVANAISAGAIGVIISDNTTDTSNGFTLSEDTTIPVVVINQASGDDLQANDGISATIINQNPASYECYDGTSMATPHVTGTAALLFAARNGDITPSEVTNALENSALDLGTSGRDNYYGYGLIDAYAALKKVIPVITSLDASPTSTAPGGSINVTVNLSTATGLTLLTANDTSLSGSGTSWTGTITADSTAGSHTIDIAVSDKWGNINHDTSLTYTTIATAPTVSIGAPSASSTSTGPVSYTITYSGATSVSLSVSDVTLNKTGTATGTISVSGSGTTARTVTISSIKGNGTLGISIAAGTASNSIGSASAAGPSATFTVTNIAPIISISSPSLSSTATGPVTYTITYTNATSITLAAADVTLNTTGTAFGSVSVSGSGTASRTVTISGITGDGTIGISVASGTATGSGGTAYSAGPSTAFTVINTIPSISISAPSINVTTSGPVTYTITYSGATTVTLATRNVTLNKTGTASGTVAVSGSGTSSRTVTISNITGTGTLGISVASGTAANIAGSAPAAGPSTTFTVGSEDPIVTFTFPTTDSSCTRNCANLDISGTASGMYDLDYVSWSLNGSSSGTCSGTTSWSATGLTLNSGSNTVTVTAVDIYGHSGESTITVTYTDALPGDAWQGIAMVSLPIIPDQTDPKDVVGFYENKWCEYDTSNAAYISYPDESTYFTSRDTTPGRGFWACFPDTVAAAPYGTIPSQTESKTIHLYKGWNIIGQPFIESITWDVSAITVVASSGTTAKSLANSSAVVANYAWGWDASSNAYYLVVDPSYRITGAVNELKPWLAYWVYAYAECDFILPPP